MAFDQALSQGNHLHNPMPTLLAGLSMQAGLKKLHASGLKSLHAGRSQKAACPMCSHIVCRNQTAAQRVWRAHVCVGMKDLLDQRTCKAEHACRDQKAAASLEGSHVCRDDRLSDPTCLQG
eukprot:1155746-Pelagomonas_calceolata.AAC.11